MKEKLPWYVRCYDYIQKSCMSKGETKVNKVLICIGIVVSIITFISLSTKPVLSVYEEIYNTEVYNYINYKFEEIFDIIIADNCSINLNNLPEIVHEFDIQYTESEIEINYSLDSKKVISEYYAETGIMPHDSYNNMKMEKSIKMNKELEKISEISSIATIPTYEQYRQEIAIGIIIITFVCGFGTTLVLYLVFLFVMFILLVGTYLATKIWEKKNKKLSNR